MILLQKPVLTFRDHALLATLRKLLPYVAIFSLLVGVYLLPADTSFSEMRKAGQLRVCMPPDYPPLVTGDHSAAGIDVELLQAVAKGLGVKLVVSSNPAMGQDFNPRNWHVTRAQCEVLAGGVIGSPVTRSFLETSPSYAETGWAFVSGKPLGDISGLRAGGFTGVSGLDRLALSRYLRAHSVEFTVVPGAAELVSGLRAGRFDFGVTEKLAAGEIAAREGLIAAWAPAELPRFPLVLGLWKGDLTLKRAIVDALERLERS